MALAFAERLNGRFRDERFNEHSFSLADGVRYHRGMEDRPQGPPASCGKPRTERFRDHIRSEIAEWAVLVKLAGLVPVE